MDSYCNATIEYYQWTQCPLALTRFEVTKCLNRNRVTSAKSLVRGADFIDVGRAGMRHARCPSTVSQSIWCLSACTTVAMESGSSENRLCQALTEMLARGRLGLFLEAYFHAPYLQWESE